MRLCSLAQRCWNRLGTAPSDCAFCRATTCNITCYITYEFNMLYNMWCNSICYVICYITCIDGPDSPHIWILVKCDIACDIASLRYLSDISCDIFFIAFAIFFISYASYYAIANNIAYDIALRYRMRYPYDAISFISHAISYYDIVCDIFAIACDISLLYRMRYPYDAISHSISHAIIS